MNSLQKHNKFVPIAIDHLINPFTGLQSEVDKAMHNFYDMFEPVKFDLGQFENLNLSPATDLVEDENSFKIEVEMPGMSEKDIKVSVDENLLTIQGEKTTSQKNLDKKYVTREINYGRYERTVSLPSSADLDKVSASFKKGMLWITIPKKAGTKGRLREVKVEKIHEDLKNLGKSVSSTAQKNSIRHLGKRTTAHTQKITKPLGKRASLKAK